MRALRAFESAGRLCSFSRAAEELHTTQSAISRTIADLEHRVAGRLFDRHHRSVSLTAAGELYHKAVTDGLARIAGAAAVAGTMVDDHRIVIACGGATSELFLRPRLKYLHQRLDDSPLIRLLHCEASYLRRPDVVNVDKIDLIVSYHSVDGMPDDEVAVFREAMAPMCSPGFAAAHADTLRRPVAHWGALPFLNFARPTLGWATWDDWFETAGRPEPLPRYWNYDDYVYVLDAAVAGQGLALGWRNFVDRFFSIGSLVVAAGEFVEFDRPLAVKLTERGRRRPLARRCLDGFASLAG